MADANAVPAKIQQRGPSSAAEIIALAADTAAARRVFTDYAARRAPHTRRRQHADLAAFAAFLDTVGIATSADALQSNPEAWRPLTWGLVEGFARWSLLQGYAVSTINVRLSTIKRYTSLAFKAGVLDETATALIRQVQAYSHRESLRIDEQREAEELPTRVGDKKAVPVRITPELAQALKQQPDTPQGRRDALLMALLLDHGLRVGEVARLQVEDVDLEHGLLRFYRPKVDRVQTHELSPDALAAVQAWFEHGDAPASGPLLRASRRTGVLTTPGLSERAITGRVRVLGEVLGIEGLSAHDCRHFWATAAARQGVDAFRLQEAGGWKSLAMPRRYIEAAEVANEGWKW